MTPSDGRVVGKAKILDNGEDWQRFTLVIMGDGYQEDQMPRFEADARAFLDHLLVTPPFYWLKPALNVYRVDVVSNEEGADDPVACAGSGAAPRTYFDATFCGDGLSPRLLTITQATALSVATAQVRGHDAVVVIVNSTKYGGSGGQVAVFSRSADAKEIGLHELGHSAFGLADEYETLYGCGQDPPGTQETHPGPEPNEPNVTVNRDPGTLKWRDMVLRGTQVPTTRNRDCRMCDTQPNPVGAHVMGAFEGARYYHCGAFRPIFNCKMRTLGQPFCPVCQRAIERRLMPFVPYGMPYAIESANFPNVYLRMDARGVQPSTSGAGVVNCQAMIGPWERFSMRWRHTDGTYAIESQEFTRWLRMDGTGVTQPVGSGGGVVNCQAFIGPKERFRTVPNVDGTVAIASVAFPHVFLRMDGRGVTQPVGSGGGIVNCQATIDAWEKFRLVPLPR